MKLTWSLARRPPLDPVDVADLRRADARIADLTDALAVARDALAVAKREVRDLVHQRDNLQRHLDEANNGEVRQSLDERHVLVAALPPAHNHDRANLYLLAAENDRLRAAVEHCEKEHR